MNNYIFNPLRISRLKEEISQIAGEEPYTVYYSMAQKLDIEYFDAIILSGGEAPLNRPEFASKFLKIYSWLRNTRKPIMGICFGHQLLGVAFGGRVARLNRKFEGFYDIDVVEHNYIFRGLPNIIKVCKSNQRIVTMIMSGFDILAKSKDYEVEAFKHQKRPIFGVQFHPEEYSKKNIHGRRILSNFIKFTKTFT